MRAGSVGSVAYEGEGQNGTFTTEPLRHETCDALVAIPTHGRLDSLNVAVVGGVLVYEVKRQRT